MSYAYHEYFDMEPRMLYFWLKLSLDMCKYGYDEYGATWKYGCDGYGKTYGCIRNDDDGYTHDIVVRRCLWCSILIQLIFIK